MKTTWTFISTAALVMALTACGGEVRSETVMPAAREGGPFEAAYQSVEQIEDAAIEKDVPYVPTPQPTVDEMLRMAGVSQDDFIYDLGSGDGRIVITAARRHGARGVGIDIDPERIVEANENARSAGVTHRVRFIQGDLFQADLSEATAVTLYLLSSVNLRLRPKLLAELRPGTPVVSHEFSMGDWEPDDSKVVDGDRLYLWIIPANVHGRWRWGGAADEPRTLYIDQKFQKFTGSTGGASSMEIRNGRLDGSEISFELVRDGVTERYQGRVNGSEINGTVTAGGQRSAWRARRG